MYTLVQLVSIASVPLIQEGCPQTPSSHRAHPIAHPAALRKWQTQPLAPHNQISLSRDPEQSKSPAMVLPSHGVQPTAPLPPIAEPSIQPSPVAEHTIQPLSDREPVGDVAQSQSLGYSSTQLRSSHATLPNCRIQFPASLNNGVQLEAPFNQRAQPATSLNSGAQSTATLITKPSLRPHLNTESSQRHLPIRKHGLRPHSSKSNGRAQPCPVVQANPGMALLPTLPEVTAKLCWQPHLNAVLATEVTQRPCVNPESVQQAYPASEPRQWNPHPHQNKSSCLTQLETLTTPPAQGHDQLDPSSIPS